MTIKSNTRRYAATPHFYCELCKVWHIDSDNQPIVHCCHCSRPLCPMIDYSCISCGRFFCDRAYQACQEDDCDVITCIGCVDRHLAISHSLEIVAL